jgi:hypothetical protein
MSFWRSQIALHFHFTCVSVLWFVSMVCSLPLTGEKTGRNNEINN